MNVTFSERGWNHYLHWQTADKKILKKINALIKECQRHPFEGTGKPIQLSGAVPGFWSRRITREHRLVYRMKPGALEIVMCRYHYG